MTQTRYLSDIYEEFRTELSNEANHHAHIVRAAENELLFRVLLRLGVDNPGGPDIVGYARKHMYEVKALCGHVFVPEKDPDNYDACQICMDVAGMHMRNAGE